MLFFAHAGITLGAATVLANLPPLKTRADASTRLPSTVDSKDPHEAARRPLFDRLARLADIRVLLIGSLLPDIIDKPLGQLILRQAVSNGRIYAHTLLFLILISAAGVYLQRRWRKTWLLVLSFGTAMHLLLDEMWRNPQTLLWPFYGFSFDKTDLSEWIPNMLHSMTTNPSVYIPEAIGAGLLLWFAYYVVRRRQVRSLVKYGRFQSL